MVDAQRTKLSGPCRRAPQDARRTRVRLSERLGRIWTQWKLENNFTVIDLPSMLEAGA
jgi:hypothetical protein